MFYMLVSIMECLCGMQGTFSWAYHHKEWGSSPFSSGILSFFWLFALECDICPSSVA